MLVLARRDHRVFFVIPWYGRTLVGTTDTDYHGDPGDARIESADVDYLLGEADRVLPSQHWDRSKILGGFVGVRALRDERGVNIGGTGRSQPRANIGSAGRSQPRANVGSAGRGQPRANVGSAGRSQPPYLVSREWGLESPKPGLLVSTGGKFSSARADAAEIVERAMAIVGRRATQQPPTENRPLPWSPRERYDRWCAAKLDECVDLGLDSETAAALIRRYGSTVDVVQATIHERPDLAERIDPDLPFSKAEIVHGATGEMALTLEDLLRRRIPLLILNTPTRPIIQQAAALAAPILGWTTRRCEEEVNAVLQRYGSDER
jgi:glycerol-3-phosphate dehydrogenase